MPSLVEIGSVVLEKKIFKFHYFVIISPWKRAGPFIWTNLNPLHPRMLCAKFGGNWPSGSGEVDFFKFRQFIFAIHNYFPLEKGGAFHLNKLESPSPKDALCLVWLKLAQWFWSRRFSNFINVFSFFLNYLGVGPFILIKFNPLHLRMLCANFVWNWLSGSGEENFLILSMYFHFFLIISLWKKTGSFIWPN